MNMKLEQESDMEQARRRAPQGMVVSRGLGAVDFIPVDMDEPDTKRKSAGRQVLEAFGCVVALLGLFAAGMAILR